MFAVEGHKLNVSEWCQRTRLDESGGYVSFEGWVRNHNAGKPVAKLQYDVYRSLAQKEGEKILKEAEALFEIERAAAVHREGVLEIGDCAVWVGVSAKHRDAAFRACRYVIDEIKLRLPIWKKEYYLEEKPVWVNCEGCSHHHGLQFSENDFYRKQESLADAMHPERDYQGRLKEIRVLVVGAGGLGSSCLPYLAGAGIGNITVCDHDSLEHHNLHRQLLYSYHDIGQPKALLAKNRLESLNPFIRVHAVTEKLTGVNVRKLVAEHDIIIDCADNFSVSYLLNDACFFDQKVLIMAAVHKWQGWGQVFDFREKNRTACLRCWDQVTPDDGCVGTCEEQGIFGVVPGAVGNWQAQKVIDIAGFGVVCDHSQMLFDFTTNNHRSLKQMRNTLCILCGEEPDYTRWEKGVPSENTDLVVEWSQVLNETEAFHLVDIRERDWKHGDHIDLAEFDREAKYAVYCHRGIKSLGFVKALRMSGFPKCFSIDGGIKSYPK